MLWNEPLKEKLGLYWDFDFKKAKKKNPPLSAQIRTTYPSSQEKTKPRHEKSFSIVSIEKNHITFTKTDKK